MVVDEVRAGFPAGVAVPDDLRGPRAPADRSAAFGRGPDRSADLRARIARGLGIATPDAPGGMIASAHARSPDLTGRIESTLR